MISLASLSRVRDSNKMSSNLFSRGYACKTSQREFALRRLQLIVSPLRLITFLISLCITTEGERVWRTSQHEDGTGLWLTRLLNAEPYQHPPDSSWHDVDNLADRSSLKPAVDKRQWFTHKKHRRMARLRVGEAFAIQQKVGVMLFIWALVALLCIAWVMRKLVLWFR